MLNNWFLQNLTPDLIRHLLWPALHILGVLVAWQVLLRLSGTAIDHLIRIQFREAVIVPSSKAGTVSALLHSLMRYLLGFIAIALILERLGVNLTPLLASAGVLSLAVALGAQTLIKDLVVGLFIFFEDQFNVGDYIEASGASGVVESVGFRVTKIRDTSGKLYIVPNSAILQVVNHSKGPVLIAVDIPIKAAADLEKAVSAIDSFGKTLSPEDFEEKPRVLGPVNVADSKVVVRVAGKGKASRREELERFLRAEVIKVLESDKIALG